jgi:hypothetical protein
MDKKELEKRLITCKRMVSRLYQQSGWTKEKQEKINKWINEAREIRKQLESK